MKTIKIKEFTDNFLEISNNLTLAEIRMLYLLISEPYVIKLSQQKFADKIGTHRRTINLGLKKLLQHKYVSDINITDDLSISSDKNITSNIEEEAEKLVLNLF